MQNKRLVSRTHLNFRLRLSVTTESQQLRSSLKKGGRKPEWLQNTQRRHEQLSPTPRLLSPLSNSEVPPDEASDSGSIPDVPSHRLSEKEPLRDKYLRHRLLSKTLLYSLEVLESGVKQVWISVQRGFCVWFFS